MESLGLLETALVVITSISAAFIVAGAFWLVSTRKLSDQNTKISHDVPTFLFDGDGLRDATQDAQLLIKDAPYHLNDRQSVIHVLSGRFPTLESTMEGLERGEVLTLASVDDSGLSIEISDVDSLIQMKLLGTNAQDGLSISAVAAKDALLSELNMLRNLTEQAPYLIWQQDSDGQLNWANQAYLDVSDALADDTDVAVNAWPNEVIFQDLHHDASPDGPVKQRRSVDLPSQNGEAWFDVTTFKNNKNALHFGSNANDAVAAENAKRQSVQTFGRIFAHLSTGLAIFDHTHRLSMFNPALIELTNLSPEFLSSKPSMQMFLDRLREMRLLPEPKDYVKWREQFPLTDNSRKGEPYCANWEIADGQTFKVTGQPNKDNSYAFFFEDISAEVSLTRRFRSDIETGQGVLDALPDAIAVFSANGTLVMSNRPYARMWDVDRDTSLRTHDLRAEMLTWQSQCAAAPIWGKLREFIGQAGDRGIWTDRAILDDGRQITCKAQPISGGMTMISFSTQSRMRPRIQQNLSMPDPAIYGMKG